jgi:ribose transport system substrate-binding protein
MSKKYLYLSISLLIFMALFISACAATRTPVPAVQEESDAVVDAPGETPAAAQEQEEEAAPAAAGEEAIKIGVIQITLNHEYQITLNDGFNAQAEEEGAEVVLCINELNPEKHVKCGEDLIAAGVNVIIQAPADPASFKAVADMAREKGIPVVNDGSPQPIMEGVVPFIGTDSLGGGRLAGEFAGQWINENLDGQAKVVTLDLPTFTDCVARVDGFEEGLAATAPEAEIVTRQNGFGLRPQALEVMENILQGNPEVDVVFGCNDDSALGAMSAMEAAGKDPAKSLVIGFDGTNDAFRAIQDGGMFRADIVQRPDLISRAEMEIAASIARGESSVEDYPDPTFIRTPVVTAENVEAWLEWGGDPAMAPQ